MSNHARSLTPHAPAALNLFAKGIFPPRLGPAPGFLTWAAEQSLTQPRYACAAFTINGKIYVVGGLNSAPMGSYTDACYSHKLEPFVARSVELFDGWAWLTTAQGFYPFRKDLWGQNFAAAGSKIYAFAAFSLTECQPSDVVEEWDVAGFNSFGGSAKTYVRPMPRFCWGSGVASKDGKIYVMGGYDPYESKCLDTVQVYNTATHEWTTATPMPRRLVSLAAVTIPPGSDIGGHILAIGGDADDSCARLLSPWVGLFDPGKNGGLGEWTDRRDLPAPVELHTAVAASNGKIYVMGGTDCYGDQPYVQEYDPGSDSWTPQTPLSNARAWLAGAALENRIYAIGGGNWKTDSTQIFSAVEAATVS